MHASISDSHHTYNRIATRSNNTTIPPLPSQKSQVFKQFRKPTSSISITSIFIQLKFCLPKPET